MVHAHNDACIVMFAKLPRLGRVKTRLQPALSAEQALDIYQKLLHHSLNTLLTTDLCPVELWFDEQPDKLLASQLQERYGPIEIRVQHGDDLGQRMQHAVQTVLRRATKIVLVGADCPAIDQDYLATAFTKLSHSISVVLGPAVDGGYVLLAAQMADLPIFDGVEWGGERVLQQTRQRLQQQGIAWFELPELIDIDRPEDLAAARSYGIRLV